MKPLLLVGGGGHCHSCIDIIEREGRYKIVGIVLQNVGESKGVMGHQIIGTDEDLPKLLERTPSAFIAVGQIKSALIRVHLYQLLKGYGARLPVIQSPLAYRSPYAVIGEGTILSHGSVVNAQSQVGANCIINSQALIEHDVRVSDHCHIATGAKVNGHVRIGEGTFIGSGSIIKEGVVIGSGVVIGAGRLVLKDVPDGMKIKANHD